MQPTDRANETAQTRPETAQERVATLIQHVRRGDLTPYDAAGLVLGALGIAADTPLPPPPAPNTAPEEESASVQRHTSSPLPPPLCPAHGEAPQRVPSSSHHWPAASLLCACRALAECVTATKPPFCEPFRDHGGNRIKTSPVWAAFKATLREAEACSPGGATAAHLFARAEEVVALVEGPHAPRWVSGGARLKDTREWCEFYVVFKAAEREKPAAAPKSAPLPTLSLLPAFDHMGKPLFTWTDKVRFRHNGQVLTGTLFSYNEDIEGYLYVFATNPPDSAPRYHVRAAAILGIVP